MFCPKCGTAYTGDYCIRCGTKQPDFETPTTPPPNVRSDTALWQMSPQESQQAEQGPVYGQENPFTTNYLWLLRNRPDLTTHKLATWVKVTIGAVALLYLVSIVLSTILQVVVLFSEMENDYSTYEFEYSTDSFDSAFDDLFSDDSPTPEPPATSENASSEAENFPTAPQSATDTGTSLYPNGISIAEYRALSLGMSYAEVSAIVGGDGIITAVDVDGANTFTALWIGEYNANASVAMTFIDQKLDTVIPDALF